VLRRTITVVLVVVGVVVIGLAIASATIWRPSDRITASLAATPQAPLLVTDPGVLEMVAGEVTVRASAEGDAPVTLAVGRDVDVQGWVGDAPHVVVTGLTTWSELAAETVDGDGESANPAGSDMWVAEADGTGEASLEWSDTGGRWQLLAATDGSAPAPRIELTWPQDVRTPFLVPGLVVGGLLLVGGLVLAVLAMLRAREPEPAGAEPSGEPPTTASPEEGK
jgi:hypothetical protein